MIITKTPYRISFFGGGTDYPQWYLKNGGEVISTTINKYIYISCRYLPPFFEHKHRIVYTKIELVNKINQIRHLAVKGVLKHYNVKEGLEIHYDGDLPARSGMGSSSSFMVGLINAVNSLYGKKLNKEMLSKKSIYIEQKILKENVGSQDQIAASYGGFNSIKFYPGGKYKVTKISTDINYLKNLNKNLILLYTGVKRTANDVASTYINKLNKEKKSQMHDVLQNLEEAKKIIKYKKNPNDFGELLNKTWMIKKSLSKSVTNEAIDDLYNSAIKNGALGGKLLGAGGGGFFLFYVPQYRQKRFIKNFNKFVNIPFQFSFNGSETIFGPRLNKQYKSDLIKNKFKTKKFKEFKI